MKILTAGAVTILASLVPGIAGANDFPTQSRIEYVLECMNEHDGKHEYLYKCSCAIDRIAGQLKHADYLEGSTALRYQSLGGKRGAEFRDPPGVRSLANRYKIIRQQAHAACFVN